MLALIGQAVTAYAAAGVVGDASCCCPVKAKCKCHDHDGKPDSAPTLKRCAGDAKLVAPAIALATFTNTIELADTPRVTIAPATPPLLVPDDISHAPEKPPF